VRQFLVGVALGGLLLYGLIAVSQPRTDEAAPITSCTIEAPCFETANDGETGDPALVCYAYSEGGIYHYFQVPCTRAAHFR
jgi:hypothetical protein